MLNTNIMSYIELIFEYIETQFKFIYVISFFMKYKSYMLPILL